MQTMEPAVISSVGPLLDRLDDLGFRLSTTTKDAVLKLAGEK